MTPKRCVAVVAVAACAATGCAVDPASHDHRSDTGAVEHDTFRDPNGCRAADTKFAAAGPWEESLQALSATLGAVPIDARWSNGDPFEGDLAVTLDTERVFVQTYRDPARCPDQWAVVVEGRLSADGVPAVSITTPQVLRDPDVPPLLGHWEVRGEVALHGAAAERASSIAGHAVNRATMFAVGASGELKSFELLTSTNGSAADVDLQLAALE